MELKHPNDVMFYNSEYIVVEYMDMIKAPYLLLARLLPRNDKLKSILKLEEIATLSDLALYEWYVMRKHQNILMELNKFPGKIGKEYLDNLLSQQINSSDNFYRGANLLAVGNMLIIARSHKLVKDMIIFCEDDPKGYVKEDVERSFPFEIKYYTDFDEVMRIAGNDSSYFLSDIRKIDRMKEADVLKYSSVTLPIEYRYNKKDMKNFDIDFDELWKTDPFKLSYARTITIDPNKNK